ncbi:MAG: cytochrome C [Nitrospirota bacterium]|nr:cytochrome C [Nitrospirota bacterium]
MTLIIDVCSGKPHNKGMKILLVVMMIVLAMASLPEAACNECHSKNPKMRKMHEALGYKDCFKCHGFGQVKKTPEERATQMTADPLCKDCHRK